MCPRKMLGGINDFLAAASTFISFHRRPVSLKLGGWLMLSLWMVSSSEKPDCWYGFSSFLVRLLRWNVCEEPYSCIQSFLLPAGHGQEHDGTEFPISTSELPQDLGWTQGIFATSACLKIGVARSSFLKETWRKSENFRSWADSLTAEGSG